LKRPEEIRAAPQEWVRVLQVAYEFLRKKQSVGDLVLFGSQAMSIYMRNPLRSKDLDLLSNQVSSRQINSLAKELTHLADVQTRATTVQTRMFDAKKMTTHAIELRVGGLPFFVEIFDRILDGLPTSLLTPYIELKKRWNLEIWTPSLEATVALRLAFRQPEGITRFDAMRLNSLIRENRRSLDFDQLNSILKKWGIESWAEKNLVTLYRRNRVRTLNDDRILPGFDPNSKV
jgi:predicted nucleotidyltransferase